ncbi:hypothetical protein [Actinophytocola sp. NPDC049390]|uniref:hypothetical protein n=1 Tax=Actinophytocola sp. NPDC049390 TaxID=3363894 RepID=UPI003797DD20
MRMRALLAGVLLVAACGPDPTPRSAPPADLVFYRSAQGIVVADGRGEVLSAGATVAAPDWARLYAVRGGDLVTIEPATGREVASTAVREGLSARVVSADGGLVALTESGGDTYEPIPRTRTRITVADPSGAAPARDFDLVGNFEPEAFSGDRTHLYVLEYLPATAPARYRVRRVELATGTVVPLLLRDKSVVPAGAEEEMRGEGRQAVLSPDRGRLYTLYLHQGDHEHTRDLLPGPTSGGSQVHAFVHVLSLTEGWAYCLDLPSPFGEHPAGTHALTVSPDGTRLYVGELTTKRVAVADTAELTITRVATLPDDQVGGVGATMSMSPDGDTLYVGSARNVLALDAKALTVRDLWPTPEPVQGLAVRPDGRQVLVGQRDHIARLDPGTGKILDTVVAPDLRTLYTTIAR